MARDSYRAVGVMLRRVDFGEKDQIVTLLLRDIGRRDAVAYGAKVSRKRFAGALDLFRLVEFTYTEGRADSLPALAEAAVVEDFRGIEASFDKITFASYATEFTREIVQSGEEADEVLDILLGYYRHTAASEDRPERLEADLYSMLLHLLARAGFGPSLDACFVSGQQVQRGKRYHFSRHGEGVVASEHRQPGQATVDVSMEAIEMLRALSLSYLAPTSPPPPARLLRQLRPLMQLLASAVLPHELKSARTLDLVLA